MSDRDEFEKWAKASGYALLKTGLNQYFYTDTAAAWDAWQAARSESAESVAAKQQYGVINQEGNIEYAAPSAQMCHDHINEMINNNPDYDEASSWVVRPVFIGSPGRSVPHEPTEAMLEAAMSERDKQHPANAKRYLRHVWQMMISTTPGNGWVRCDERLPTEADANEYGCVRLLHPTRERPIFISWGAVNATDGQWMPDNTPRTEPPQGGQAE
jgi:hypothetical protein